MKELTEEIKHTIEMMNGDIDDGAHSELQSHLYSLLEMKRELLKTQLGQQHQNKMLTVEDLKRGDWWCADVGAGCANALKAKGLTVLTWRKWGVDSDYDCCAINEYGNVSRAAKTSLHDNMRQIKRIGSDFYYC